MGKNKIAISVIMSAYNSEKYLAEAIDSILNQTLKNFELIIFEDGSSDKTAQIIRKYAKKDKRIKPVYNALNKGYGGFIKNLNRGIKLAKGKYIARMDSDDISLPKRLEEQYAYLEKNKEIFLIGGSIEYIDANGKTIYKQINDYGPQTLEKKLPYESLITHPTVMFRKRKGISYREKVFYCEDRDLWLRLVTMGAKMRVLPIVAIKYRVHENSIGSAYTTKQKLFLNKTIEWYFQRKKYGKDNYKSFNPDSILSLKNESGNKNASIRQIKLAYRSNLSRKLFRKKVVNHWKKYGISCWLPSIGYYASSFILKRS